MSRDDAESGPPALGENVAPQPERPPFSRNLDDPTLLKRPRAVPIAGLLLVACAGAHAAVTAMAVPRLDRLRASLSDDLVDAADGDYERADIERAVDVVLGVSTGLLVLFLLLLAMNHGSLRRRRLSGRTGFVVNSILFMVVAAISFGLRQGSERDVWLTGAGLLALLVAVMLVVSGPVARWLRQVVRPPRYRLDQRSSAARDADPSDDSDPQPRP